MAEIIKINYVELPGKQMTQSKQFFSEAFGWEFTDYGSEYFSFNNAGIDGGMDGTDNAVAQPLIVLKAADLEAALARVKNAGGIIIRDIFEFPGGRRFHFKEPSGNEMAIWGD